MKGHMNVAVHFSLVQFSCVAVYAP